MALVFPVGREDGVMAPEVENRNRVCQAHGAPGTLTGVPRGRGRGFVGRVA